MVGQGGAGGREERCHKVNTFSAAVPPPATNTTITEISRHHSHKAEIPPKTKHLAVIYSKSKHKHN